MVLDEGKILATTIDTSEYVNNNNKVEASASISSQLDVLDANQPSTSGFKNRHDDSGKVLDQIIKDWDLLFPDCTSSQVKLSRVLFSNEKYDNYDMSSPKAENESLLKPPKVEAPEAPEEVPSPTVEIVANITTPKNLIHNMSILKDELDHLVDTSVVQCHKAIRTGNIETKCQDFFRREALRTNGGCLVKSVGSKSAVRCK